MNYYGYEFVRESDLTHHGILGQKWGVRRFQNKDGTLTVAGKKRRAILQQAGKYAKDTSDIAYKSASSVKESHDRTEKRYGGENGWMAYAKDAYGTVNGKEFGITQKEFEKAMKTELEDLMSQSKADDELAIKAFEEIGKEFFDKADKWLNSPIDSFSEKDIAEAKKFIQEVQTSMGHVVKTGLETGEYELEGNVLKTKR